MDIKTIIKNLEIDLDKKILFDEDAHTYTNRIENFQYANVSSFFKTFYDVAYQGFDMEPEKKAFILKRAKEIGLFIHKLIEDYIKDGNKTVNHHNYRLRQVGHNTLINFERWSADHKINILASEIRVACDVARIAGTIDLVFERAGKIYLADFKTSRVDADNIDKLSALYALQLSMYQKLMLLSNIKIDGLLIIFINKRSGVVTTKKFSNSLLEAAQKIVDAIFNQDSQLEALSDAYKNNYLLS